MSEFVIERFAATAGHTRVVSGRAFEAELVVVDDDLEGGPCVVSLTVKPSACQVTPKAATVDVPAGDAQGRATVEVTLSGPAGTSCRVLATLANGQQRRLRLMLAEAP